MPTLNAEFIARMENLLALYARAYNPREPVVCTDEKSKQLLENTRATQLTKPNRPRRQDYEYRRQGVRNIFLAVEPKAGYRKVTVTKRRTKQDFARFIRSLLAGQYRGARKLHLVADNLNTHFKKSFVETFGKQTAQKLLKRIVFHYTPKHASWLNMAEIELSILSGQALRQRIPTATDLKRITTAWQRRRNRHHEKINWKFTVTDARAKFKY